MRPDDAERRIRSWLDDGPGRAPDDLIESVLAEVAYGGRAEVERAVTAAARAMPAWQALSVYDRARILKKTADLLRSRADSLDWDRLTARFGERWPLLYMYLTFFSFVYPSDAHRLPAAVLDDYTAKLAAMRNTPVVERVCNGTLVSRAQYLIDIGQYGYADARLAPRGGMAAEDAIFWTWAIDHVT